MVSFKEHGWSWGSLLLPTQKHTPIHPGRQILPPNTFFLVMFFLRIFERLPISFHKSKCFGWICKALHNLACPISPTSSPTRLLPLASLMITASHQPSGSSQLPLLNILHFSLYELKPNPQCKAQSWCSLLQEFLSSGLKHPRLHSLLYYIPFRSHCYI